MISRSFSEVIKGVERYFSAQQDILQSLMETHISAVCDDSRNCVPGCIFLAVRGVETDGHLYINQAIENGAEIVVCETVPLNKPADVTFLAVQDSRLVLGFMAQNWFGRPADSMLLLGVTGTNGKTTVSYLVYELLRLLDVQAGLIGTTGNVYNGKVHPTPYTTPEPLMLAEVLSDMKEAGVQVCVMEVSSHALSLHRIAGLEYAAVGFTNFTQDHLDFHGSMDDYFHAKCSIAQYLANGARMFVHTALAERVANTVAVPVQSYGLQASDLLPDLSIEMQTGDSDHAATVSYQHQTCSITSNMAGFYNIENTVLACAMVQALGYDFNRVCSKTKHLQGPPGRMQVVRGTSGLRVIVDYAHTPDALERALSAVREQMNPHQSLYCVFGCGGDRDKTKRPTMGRIAELGADVVIVTSDNPRTESQNAIIEDIVSGMQLADNIKQIPHRKEAIIWALEHAEQRDVVLIAGKGHEEYQIIGAERLPFSDVEVVRHHFSLSQS